MENNFMRLLDNFKDVLDQLNKNLIQLVELENQKYEALRQVDIKRIMSINSIEEEMIQYSDILEKKRVETINQLAKELDFDRSLKLSEMVTYFPVDRQSDFLELKKDINTNSKKLQITIRENDRISKTNMDIINFTLNFAKGSPSTNTYNFRENNQSRENIYIVDRLA